MIGSIKANSVTSDLRIGFRAAERLRVQYDRTVTSKGFNRSNGLGFQSTERLTNINKELT